MKKKPCSRIAELQISVYSCMEPLFYCYCLFIHLWAVQHLLVIWEGLIAGQISLFKTIHELNMSRFQKLNLPFQNLILLSLLG